MGTRVASTALLLAAAVVYAALLASTRPFTAPADAITAVGLAAAAAGLVARLVADHGRGAVPPEDGGAEAGAAEDGAAEAGAGPRERSRADGGWLPWAVLVAAVVGWELYCFFGGPRPAHPTLSSLYDLAARYRWLKAAVVLAWLGLGWELVRR